MELDPRIKSKSDILTIFDIDEAKEFVGQKGYFANVLYNYSDLSDRRYRYYGTLEAVFDTEGLTFRAGESGKDFPYFLPESSLKPIEKKYRPYTFQEFWDDFAVGHPVKFRKKGEEGDELYFILNGYSRKQYRDVTVQYINLGGVLFTLKELFDGYEWHEDATGDWRPFAVEVEE